MDSKPLTSEAIALTEKKMNMALDDIVRMSKSKAVKPKAQRVSNRTERGFNNISQDKFSKVRRFMGSKSSLRQGALAQRRSNFQVNRFPLATDTARKAAVAPMRARTSFRGRAVNMNKFRVGVPPVQRKATTEYPITKQPQQEHQPLRQPPNVMSKPRPQTLDSLFATMKEQRMRAFSQQQNSGRRWSSAVQQIPPWGRGRFGNW